VTDQDHLVAIALPLLRYKSNGYRPSIEEIACAVRDASHAMSRQAAPSRAVQAAVIIALVEMTEAWEGLGG
jgi:hypothetical protein